MNKINVHCVVMLVMIIYLEGFFGNFDKNNFNLKVCC
jgi:hypothetical protein